MVHLSERLKTRIMELAALRDNLATRKRFQGYWNLLEQNDQFLADFINHVPGKTGNVVLANMLHVLNHEIDEDVCNVLKLLGLPESVIPEDNMEEFLHSITDQPGFVEVDGILCQNSPFAGMDPNWIELFLSYVWFAEFPAAFSPFGNTPSVSVMDSEKPLTIAIMGDWGTGQYDDFGFSSPSALVGQAIKGLKPDITIHLGDVYYAGNQDQIVNRLISGFPAGNIASYTMNGNHEMFDGANGYFKTGLTHPIFKQQQQTSYFAIRQNDWVILGLDTAYYDSSLFHLAGTLTDQDQLDFIASLKIQPHQKIILLTHHYAMHIDGASVNEPLFSQVYSALGNRYPDYWYYGHTHNGVVYNDMSAQGGYKCLSGSSPAIRCMGHASIPIGNATGLHDEKGNPIRGIDYYAATPIANPSNNPGLQNRVRNGFTMLTLNGSEIKEVVYEASEEGIAIPVWNNAM